MILIMQKSCVVYDGKENKAPRLNIVVLQKRWEEKNNDLPLPFPTNCILQIFTWIVFLKFLYQNVVPIKSLPK